MKKFLVSVIAAASVLAVVAPVQAANSVPANFDVNITLTSACQITTPPSNVAFTYTSLGAAAASSGGGFSVQCSNSLPYTLGLDATTVTDAAVNLTYTLALSATSATGSGVAQPYTITGGITAGQAGNCTLATCNNSTSLNKTRTLTIGY
jgi:spore coat protein U-like protein